MPILSRFLILTGLLSLFHAAYSAHEFSSFSTTSLLPLDITLETLVSILLCCVGLVLGAEPLKPISWSAWAGEIEKTEGAAGNPFRGSEERRGFVDIRGKRREFADWVRERDIVEKK